METPAILPGAYPASYSQFDLRAAVHHFGLALATGPVVRSSDPVPPPAWLTDLIGKTAGLNLSSEKAKSEYIIAPVLLAVRDHSGERLAIHSGMRFDVDPARGLRGYCDFIIGQGDQPLILQAPLVALVEVKENSIEGGLGQCAAEMVAADLFNQQEGHPGRPVFGCVTNTLNWQFLRLERGALTVDTKIRFLTDLPAILGIFQAMADEAAAPASL